MKQKIINLSLTFVSMFILGVVLALSISTLTYFQIINVSLNDNLILIFSLLLFFLVGFIFGIKEKKKGLLNGLLLTIIYLISIFTLKVISDSYQYSSIYIILTRSLLIIIGCIIGVNISSKKN